MPSTTTVIAPRHRSNAAVVPASSAEIELATEQGTDALFEIWEQQETDLADLTRPSAV
jgi:hypothetical protein